MATLFEIMQSRKRGTLEATDPWLALRESHFCACENRSGIINNDYESYDEQST